MFWTECAKLQAGLVTRRQLTSCGLTPGKIRGMTRRGHLAPTRTRGIYQVVGAPSTPQTRAWLAVLASASPLSYLTAARLWGFEPLPVDDRIHITRRDRRRLDWPPGVRVHRVDLRPTDVAELNSVPLTSPTVTALDCLGWLDLRAARRFGDRAIQQGWLTTHEVELRLTDRPGRWGNRQLKNLLSVLDDGAAAESERRLHGLLRRGNIGNWIPNLRVRLGGCTYVIDVAIPEHRLAIEVDGYRHHSSVSAFERDRSRQNALVAAGWTVLRFTWWDITERPDTVIATITSLLAA